MLAKVSILRRDTFKNFQICIYGRGNRSIIAPTGVQEGTERRLPPYKQPLASLIPHGHAPLTSPPPPLALPSSSPSSSPSFHLPMPPPFLMVYANFS